MNTERLKGWLSSSSKLVAASAQLAKKQAELATLNNVTLPKLYHAIGKRIIDAEKLPPDLVEYREKIRDLEAAIAAKPEEPKSEPASGFAAKAKQLAQQAASKTAKVTSDATARVRIQTAYVSLGKHAVERYAGTLPEDLVNKLCEIRRVQKDLGTAITALNSTHVGRSVTPTRLTLATLCCLAALGGLLVVSKGRTYLRSTHGSSGQAKDESADSEELKEHIRWLDEHFARDPSKRRPLGETSPATRRVAGDTSPSPANEDGAQAMLQGFWAFLQMGAAQQRQADAATRQTDAIVGGMQQQLNSGPRYAPNSGGFPSGGVNPAGSGRQHWQGRCTRCGWSSGVQDSRGFGSQSCTRLGPDGPCSGVIV